MPGLTARSIAQRRRLLFLLLAVAIVTALSYTLLPRPEEPDPESPYTVVDTHPHDPEAFTQGLVYRDGRLYEGTGLRGQSSVRIVEPKTGEVTRIHHMPSEYFGEGITIHGDRVIQVTWQSRMGFVYDVDTLEPLDTFTIDSEGWGLTHDGDRLILSDGTPTLRFLDPETFQETGSVEVLDGVEPVWHINELEYIDGVVYANIWQTDRVALIDPGSGSVLEWLDLSGLRGLIEDDTGIDVLNGIAYDEESGHLYVTGKLWTLMFEIEFTPEA
jgi:glutamine cyclotransferase